MFILVQFKQLFLERCGMLYVTIWAVSVKKFIKIHRDVLYKVKPDKNQKEVKW